VSSNITIIAGQTFYGYYDPYGKKSHVDGGTFLAYGGNPLSGYTWTLSSGSAFPSGVTLSLNGILSLNAGGLIIPGSYSFNVTVSDGSSSTSATVYFIADTESTAPDSNGISTPSATVGFQQLSLGSYALASGQVGLAYGASLFVNIGTGAASLPLNWTLASGSLPPGLTLDAARGVVRGSPTSAGTYSFTIAITDSTGLAAVGTPPVYSITVNP
jgi:hypothetical protein